MHRGERYERAIARFHSKINEKKKQLQNLSPNQAIIEETFGFEVILLQYTVLADWNSWNTDCNFLDIFWVDKHLVVIRSVKSYSSVRLVHEENISEHSRNGKACGPFLFGQEAEYFRLANFGGTLLLIVFLIVS